MKYNGYTDLGIVSSVKPFSQQQLVEITAGTKIGWLFLVDSADENDIYYSSDKADNWTLLTGTYSGLTNKQRLLWYRPSEGTQGMLHFLAVSPSSIVQDYNINLVDLSEGLGGSFGNGVTEPRGIELLSGNRCTFCTAANVNGYVRVGSPTHAITKLNHSMGTIGGRSLDMSYTIQAGTADDAYFVFGWSDENAKLYKYDYSANTITEIYEMSNTIVATDRNRKALAYDGSDVIFMILQDKTDSKYYLWSYSITDDSAVKTGEYNVALMSNNQAQGELEKAFHISEYKVYQIQKNSHQLHLISILNSDAVFVGITNNFLMNDDGDMWELIDLNSNVYKCNFDHQIMKVPEGTMVIIKDNIIIERGLVVKIEGMYTSAGSSAIDTIFEGKVIDFDDKKLQKVWIESFAKKELMQKPKGNYSGRSDEIMASLVGDYCKYITIGTLGTGSAMGTITYAGDKTLWTILTNLAKFENWIWYLTPTGQLYFNNGTVDSLVNVTETSNIWRLRESNMREPYNYFDVRGAFVNNIQLIKILEEADDLISQQLYGLNPLSETYAEFNTQGLVDSMAASRKARMKLSPSLVNYFHYDSTKGFIQPGETKTFSCNKPEPNISSGQFYIHGCKFNAKQGIGDYKIADELI